MLDVLARWWPCRSLKELGGRGEVCRSPGVVLLMMPEVMRYHNNDGFQHTYQKHEIMHLEETLLFSNGKTKHALVST